MLDYTRIPVPYMIDAIREYMERGIPPGRFLGALLSNDLMGVFREADGSNLLRMLDWVRWLREEAPAPSYGSPENVARWIAGNRKKVRRGDGNDSDQETNNQSGNR